jgi:hypothetical protein
MESIAAGIMFIAPDLPVEPAGVPVGVVLEVVVAAVPVGLLVDDGVAAAGAICKLKIGGQSPSNNYLIQKLRVNEVTHQGTRETLRKWSSRINTNRTHPHGINITLYANLPSQATEISCISSKGSTVDVCSIPEVPATICANWGCLKRGLTRIG